MSGWLDAPLFALLGGALVVLGLGFYARELLREDSALARHFSRYRAHLERSLLLLFLPNTANRILVGQAVALFGTTVFTIGSALGPGSKGASDYVLGLALGAIAALGPELYLRRKRKEHIARLETQTDALLAALANALKTVPSPVVAFEQAAEILPNPMRLEVDRLLRELQVGTTLEQAILNMSSRVRSRELDTALSSVLIGLQVGGNLPQVLESSAAAIREMNRLQGVVRTKTAEGRAQLWVLGVFPFAICFALLCIDRNYFKPLQATIIGTLCVTVAMTFWFGALLLARKILKVDL